MSESELTIEQLKERMDAYQSAGAECAKYTGNPEKLIELAAAQDEWSLAYKRVGYFSHIDLAELALSLAEENERLREALQGLMYFADRVLYSFNGDLSRHQRWEEAREAARLALNGQK